MNSAALDRHITGNYGEDYSTEYDHTANLARYDALIAKSQDAYDRQRENYPNDPQLPGWSDAITALIQDRDEYKKTYCSD